MKRNAHKQVRVVTSLSFKAAERLLTRQKQILKQVQLVISGACVCVRLYDVRQRVSVLTTLFCIHAVL